MRSELPADLRKIAAYLTAPSQVHTLLYAADELDRVEVLRSTSKAGLLLDTLILLPRLSSGALRKIAYDCVKLIAGRMEDGIPD